MYQRRFHVLYSCLCLHANSIVSAVFEHPTDVEEVAWCHRKPLLLEKRLGGLSLCVLVHFTDVLVGLYPHSLHFKFSAFSLLFSLASLVLLEVPWLEQEECKGLAASILSIISAH